MRNKVFISYAHVDQEEVKWIDRLKLYLSAFEQKGILDIWDDSKMEAGKILKDQIINAINDSRIAILLIGPGFLGSNFINNIELPKILESARVDGLHILPLITSYCSYKHSDLKDFASFNLDSKPLEALNASERNKIINEFSIRVVDIYNKNIPSTKNVIAPDVLLTNLQTIEIQNNRLTSCCFTSNKNQILCSGFESELVKVDLDNNSVEKIKTVDSISRVIFRIPNSSTYLVGFDNGEVFSTDINLSNFKSCFKSETSIFSIDFNIKTQTLITSERNGDVKEWLVDNLDKVIEENDFPEVNYLKKIFQHKSNAFMFKYSEKYNWGVSVGADGIVHYIDFNTGKTKMNKESDNPLFCVSISNNKNIAIGAAMGKVLIKKENDKTEEIKLHIDTIRTLYLSDDCRWLFTGSKDKTVKIRNLQTGQTLIIKKCKDYVYDIKYSSAFNQLMICDGAGYLSVFTFNKPVDKMTKEEMEFFFNKIN